MTSIDSVVATSMKLTCAKEELAEKLQVAGRGVSTRASVQILAGILLRAASGQLSLSATDMEISLRVSLDAQVEDEGSVVVPGRLLVDIVRLLPAGEVTISHRAEEGVVELVCGSASYRLHTYAAEDFPRLPEIDDSAAFTVDKEAFVDTIAELARIAQGGEPGSLQVGVQENQVVFGVDDVWLTARRIDGQFPNYKQLLPETFEAEVTMRREEFLDVVRRTSVLAQRKSPLRLRFEEGELTVSAQTQDVGEARESLPISYSGETIEIGFNAEFLRDGLESVSDDNVRVKLISPLRPGLIHGESDDFLYLIMPIRLAG